MNSKQTLDQLRETSLEEIKNITIYECSDGTTFDDHGFAITYTVVQMLFTDIACGTISVEEASEIWAEEVRGF